MAALAAAVGQHGDTVTVDDERPRLGVRVKTREEIGLVAALGGAVVTGAGQGQVERRQVFEHASTVVRSRPWCVDTPALHAGHGHLGTTVGTCPAPPLLSLR